MGPTRATAALTLAATLAFPGCALSHERAPDLDTRTAPRHQCDHGAITYCAECERPVCCLHFCQEDRTWSACSYVQSACPDGGPAGDTLGERDR